MPALPPALAMPEFREGTVWLVGSGPGEASLLTLQAVHALQQADVIVYDALVPDEVLVLAKNEARRIFAGKRGGKPSMAQQEITRLLIDLARDNLRVLRLKGGDPFVFGRGGEEALDLAQAGIAWRIVPGLTSGLAGLALAGIPATTRLTNQGVILVTGHAEAGGTGSPDWAALAHTKMPLIIYMGMTHLTSIAGALMKGGLAPATPVAIIAHASLPQQQMHVTVLERAAEDARLHGLVAPAIIAIGAIAALRDMLSLPDDAP